MKEVASRTEDVLLRYMKGLVFYYMAYRRATKSDATVSVIGGKRVVPVKITREHPEWERTVQRVWFDAASSLIGLWVPPEKFGTIPWYTAALIGWKPSSTYAGPPSVKRSDVWSGSSIAPAFAYKGSFRELPDPKTTPSRMINPLSAPEAFIEWAYTGRDRNSEGTVSANPDAPTYAQVCQVIEEHPEIVEDEVKRLLQESITL